MRESNNARIAKIEEKLAPPGAKPVEQMTDEELYDIVFQDFDERYPRKDGRRWRHDDITLEILSADYRNQKEVIRKIAEGETE